MSWRPKKRTLKQPTGKAKTVWIARYGLDTTGKELLAKPHWNNGRPRLCSERTPNVQLTKK